MYGPVRTVVWQGSAGDCRPYADAARTLFRRTQLMKVYGTGMRRSELANLKVSDIDNQRMIIRVVAGKGGKFSPSSLVLKGNPVLCDPPDLAR